MLSEPVVLANPAPATTGTPCKPSTLCAAAFDTACAPSDKSARAVPPTRVIGAAKLLKAFAGMLIPSASKSARVTVYRKNTSSASFEYQPAARTLSPISRFNVMLPRKFGVTTGRSN